MISNDGELLPSDLEEAKRYMPQANDAELRAFAWRQLRARRRLTLMLDFYRRHGCRLARLQLLAGCAIALGRFAAFSQSFDDLGEAFMPVDEQGQPRHQEWHNYAAACAARRPMEVREELWLAAHMKDLEAARRTGLDDAFYEELRQHPDEPTWRLLQQHMEVTVGARLLDHAALSGAWAYETAFGDSLVVTVRRLFTKGWKLLGRYALETARALLKWERNLHPEVVSNARTAVELLRYSLRVWSASQVFRRGMRARERGSWQSENGWPLLEEVLGERIHEVHPLIVDFYTNPSRYAVKARLELNTLPAKFWSRLGTLLVGQGLYESDATAMEARFRVFRRQDGSMHFVRELYCGEVMRVFDSDFIVRQMQGEPRLFEVFVDLKVDIEMAVTPMADGGLAIRCTNFYLRGVRLPVTGLQVEFQSRVVGKDNAPPKTLGAEQAAPFDKGLLSAPQLQIDGHLRLQPRTRWGKFFAYKILRRPEQLACIHYLVTAVQPVGSSVS
ncbi:MAG: hypothetical protein HY231_05945 [Acidobacteria bacterium]|nr:hypothetical protein [Acidobacteriota bacterium]